MKYNLAFVIAALALVHSTASGDGEYFAFSFADYEFTASPGTTFTIQNSFVWAAVNASTIVADAGDYCDCLSAQDADADAGMTYAEAAAYASGEHWECPFTSSRADSSLFASSTRISWNATWVGDGGHDQYCSDAIVIYLPSGAYGADVSFTTDGEFTFTNPTCPSPTAGNGTRRVDANLICLPSGPIASYTVSNAGAVSQNCSNSTNTLGAGSYTVESISITIDDAVHDVTSDGRFNQDDIDWLVNNVIGTAFAIDPIYVERFDFRGDGTVDTNDINSLQCFVDACLDARRIGDANCDNAIDCADLLLAVSQPFAGEFFTGSTYNVGFDTDLDGDNDAIDKAAISDRMLQLEPANFVFDGNLNFFDASMFLTLYGNQDPRADMNGDGLFNFLDTSAFLTAFSNPNCLVP